MPISLRSLAKPASLAARQGKEQGKEQGKVQGKEQGTPLARLAHLALCSQPTWNDVLGAAVYTLIITVAMPLWLMEAALYKENPFALGASSGVWMLAMAKCLVIDPRPIVWVQPAFAVTFGGWSNSVAFAFASAPYFVGDTAAGFLLGVIVCLFLVEMWHRAWLDEGGESKH